MTVESLIDYPNLVLDALRRMVASVLREVSAEGLPGGHHFYITFRTDAEGVSLPANLRRAHPDELTVILQHQFWGLEVDDERFSVILRFSGVETPITVPFAAMTAFADPAVDFALQLALPAGGEEPPEPPDDDTDGSTNGEGTVIAFDRGRKR